MPADRTLPPSAIVSPLLRAWLGAGLVLLAVQSPQHWHNHYVGWVPYWLAIAPSLCLALLHRDRLAAALSAFLVRGRRRRNLSRPLRARATHARHSAAARFRRTAPAAMIGG